MKGRLTSKVKVLVLIAMIICLVTTVLSCFANIQITEAASSQTATFDAFEELTGDISKTDSEFVKFEAYFESPDGKKYSGIRQELNESVVLKTKLTVDTQGTLKNAKITLESNGNFSMVRNIPTDEYVKSVTSRTISFNEMTAGHNKPVDITMKQNIFDSEYMNTFDVNLLSKTNKLTFTGDYTGSDGVTKTITKEIEFRIDWYGSIEYEFVQGFWCRAADNVFVVDSKSEKVYIICNPYVFTRTGEGFTAMAPDAGTVIKGNAPKMGDYYPTSVYVNDISASKKNITKVDYDSATGSLEIHMENPLNNGIGSVIYYENLYQANIVMEYPIDAYNKIEATTNSLQFKATAYLEGWSTDTKGKLEKVQSNTESISTAIDLQNPKGSVLLYNVDIDDTLLSKTNSRLMYDKNINMDVKYKVDWTVNFYMYDDKIKKFVFSEKYSEAKDILDGAYKHDTDHFSDEEGQFYDMDPFIQYEAIRVDAAAFNVLGEDGQIIVYDADSGKVIKTITSSDVNELLEYKTPVKHIKIETTKPVTTGTIKIEHMKNIDNPTLKNLRSKEEFEKYNMVYSALHGLVEYDGEADLRSINGDVEHVEYKEGSTLYEPLLNSDNYTFDPQKLNKNTMTIRFFAGYHDIDRTYTAWVNPTLYIEFPETFTKIKYNSFSVNNYNVKVKKVSTEKKEGHIVLKIETEGVITSTADVALKFQSSLNNPNGKSEDTIRVFGYNDVCQVYEVHLPSSKEVPDVYDINKNSDVEEDVRVENVQMYYAKTDHLITTTQITDFDDEGTIVEGPEVASVLRDNSKGHARVNIVVSNGYSNPISNTVIVGRIPFAGNHNVLHNNVDLQSTFSTTMQSPGIKVDEDNHQPTYEVFYSTDGNATKDSSDWVKEPNNWDEIKSYKIVISSQIPAKTNFGFYYTVDLPEPLTYGEVTYADHAIYFDSVGTVFSSETEPEKVGLQIGDRQYRLEINDYKFRTDELIPHATDTVTDASSTIQLKGENYGEDWTENHTEIIGKNAGEYEDLYFGAIYTIKQNEIDNPYIPEEEEIDIRLIENPEGELEAQILNETGEVEYRALVKRSLEDNQDEFVKGLAITDEETETPTVQLDIQNKYKYDIVVENRVKDTDDEYIENSEFTLEGKTQETEGKSGTTNGQGTTKWGDYVLDEWTITQDTVGEECFERDEQEHKLNVTIDENGKLTTDGLENLTEEDVWVENENDFTKQPVIHVVIENDYKPAVIETKKESSVSRKGDYVLAGDEITYTISVSNTGHKETDVTVTDAIPDGTDFVDGSIQVVEENGNAVQEGSQQNYTEDDLTTNGIQIHLEPNQTRKVIFKVKVQELPADQTSREIKNKAQVSEGTEPKEKPDHTPESTPITEKKPDLQVSKDNDKKEYVTKGDEITYTITLDNTKGTAPISVLVKDPIPEHTQFKEGSIKVLNENNEEETEGDPAKTYEQADLTEKGIKLTIEAGKKKYVKFTVTVLDSDPEDKITNVASYWEKDPNDPDKPDFPEYPEEPDPEDKKDTPKVENPYKEPQLSSTKTSSIELPEGIEREYAVAGDTIEYTITVKNTGNMAGKVTVSDNIPDGTKFVEDSITVTDDKGTEQTKENGEKYTKEDLNTGIEVTVAEDSSKIIKFKVKVLPIDGDAKEKQIENTALVKHDEKNKPDEQPKSEPIPEYKPDLNVTKSNQPTEAVKVGDVITYTITLDNSNGKAPVKTTVKDEAPKGTVFVKDSIVVKVDNVEQDEEYTEDNLKAGIAIEVPEEQTVTVEFRVKVTQSNDQLNNGDKIENTATVIEEIPDPEDPDNPTTKEHTPKVENEYKEPKISAKKNATIKTSSENTRTYAIKGDTITYTITLTNDGDLDGDVIVKDAIPQGTKFVAGSIKVFDDNDTEVEKQGNSYDETDLTTNGIVVTVKSHKTAKLTFDVIVNDTENTQTTIKNTATYKDKLPDPEDPKEPEPDEKTTEEVKTPVVEFTKIATVSRSDKSAQVTENSATLGDEITYTITVTNKGEEKAENIKVTDTIPDYTKYKETQDSGTYDEASKTITWTIEELQSGQSQTLNFTVIVTEEPEDGKFHNIAYVGGRPSEEVENNYVKPEIEVKKSSKVEVKEPEVEKNWVTKGDTITYILTIKNTGGAEGRVTIKDKIPEGTEFVSDSINVKSQDGTVEPKQDGTYSKDDLTTNGIVVKVKPNETKTLEFQVTVQDGENGKDILNKATYSVKGPNDDPEIPEDPKDEPTNEVTNEYKEPNITTEKLVEISSGEAYAVPGDTLTYKIKITNTGKLGKTVKVKDKAPEGTTFVDKSVEITKDDVVEKQEEVTNDQLEAGIDVEVQENSTVIVSFKVKVSELSDGKRVLKVINKAQVDDEDTPQTETIVDKSDLKISKVNDPKGNVKAGDTITYTIVLDNTNGTAATTVKVKDEAPDGTDFVKDSIKILKVVSNGDDGETTDQLVEGQANDEENLKQGIQVKVDAHTKMKVQFQVTVQDLENGTKIRNVATVTDVPPEGQDPSPETQERETPPVENVYVEPIITVKKDVSTEYDREYVVEGETITYTISIKNDGDLAETITIKDTKPDKTEFVDGSIVVKSNNGEVENLSYTEQQLNEGIDIKVEPRSTYTLEFKVKVLSINSEETNVVIKNVAYYKEKKDPEPEPDPWKPTDEAKTPVIKYSKEAEITRNSTEEIVGNTVTAGDVIKYTITVENVSDTDVENLKVKDTIPEGTTLKKVYDSGKYNSSREITWTIAQLSANTKKTVSFEVKVNYQSNNETIKNVARVDDKPTNEVDTPYEKPESKLEVDVRKSGDVAITNEETKVMYKIQANTTIKDFVGKAKITIVDTLPFPIDDTQSELDHGTYWSDGSKHTITWEETVDVDTYKPENATIERVKNLQLKYNYPDINNIGEVVDNEVTLTVELLQNQKDPDNPDEPDKEVSVDKQEDQDDYTVPVEIPADVVVHHYLWDDSRGGETTDEVAPDKHIEGFVGRRYETEPSDEVDPNYECVNPDPNEDNHTGTFEKDQKDVYYYYKLKDPVVENSVNKTAEATVEEEREFETGQFEDDGTPIKEKKKVQVLTQENGIVKYHIEQKIKIDKYKGKVTLTLTDTLPAKIDTKLSKLEEGNYDEESNTITWTKEIEINTFDGEPYTETITKDIELVYLDRNFVEPLTNTVDAKVTLYYPESYKPNPEGERIIDEKEDTETVEQKYTVDKEVRKDWQDNGNSKNRRPTSVTVELTADGMATNNKAVLDASNNWSANFENLPKYSDFGDEIVYSVIETETNLGELAFYEAPIVEGENPIVVTNRYRTMEANVDASVDKIQKDNETVTNSSQKIKYEIKYNATIKDYIGNAKLTIVDHLPYHIDEAKSTLSDGVYDANRKTITWEIPINNINADAITGYAVQFDKNIELVFSDMDASIGILSNRVEARLDLFETDSSKTVEDTEIIPVDILGHLIVHYKDKATGEELTYEENGETKEYRYEEDGKVGSVYTTSSKEIPDYKLDSVEGEEMGTYPDGTVEVTYWYESDKSGGIDVKWVDEDGNDIVPPEHIPGEGEPGKVGDPYHTEPKEFDDYVLDYVEGEPDGTLPEGTGEVVYHYKKRNGRVIVQYLEKGTENELLPEKVEEYPIGDDYTTERENIPNYRRADPEPENKNGIVTKEDTYVKYYYERIPSGKVVTKHVDVDTGEEILYPDEDTGEYVPYGDEQEGYVGDPYTTEPEDIPYYKLVEELLPPNKDGVFEEGDKEVVYYYEKQVFNFEVDKVITKATINGEEQKVLDGKLIKVEIVGSEMEDTDVEITYKIRVKNTGEIAGTTKVVEKLPKHFTIGKEAYDEWTENKNGDLEAEVSLEPGETKEFTIKLTWKRGSENFGREINTAEIKDFNNDAHYDDNNEKDNTSEAEVVMSVKTGAPTHVFFIIYVLIILVAIIEVIAYIRKIKLK